MNQRPAHMPPSKYSPTAVASAKGRTGKKPMAIDSLVRWAWRDELPKATVISPVMPSGFSNPWNSVSRYLDLLATIQEPDVRNRYGLVPDLTAASEPHPDAIAIWWHVQDLAGLSFRIGADWNPLEGFDIAEEHVDAAISRAIETLCFRVGRQPEAKPIGRDFRRWRLSDQREGLALRRSTVDVVQTHAILGGYPPWETETPQIRTVSYDNGQPKWFRRDTMLTETGAVEVELDGFDRKSRRPRVDAYLKHFYE